MERSVKKSFDHCFLAFASTKLLLFLVSFPQYLPKILARLTVFFHCHRLVPSSKCKSTSRCRSMAHHVTFSGHRGANMRCLHGSAKKNTNHNRTTYRCLPWICLQYIDTESNLETSCMHIEAGNTILHCNCFLGSAWKNSQAHLSPSHDGQAPMQPSTSKFN